MRPTVVSRGEPERRHRSVTSHALLLAAAVVAIAAIAWTVAGLLFAILHLIELVAVASVAGWIGYRAGRLHRGDRSQH